MSAEFMCGNIITELRKVAGEIVASIRKGLYTDCSEFTLRGSGAGKDVEHEFVRILGSGVCVCVNETLNNEKLSCWIKANYQFVAMITDKKGDAITITCGFIDNDEKKKIKQMAKESGGRMDISTFCEYCEKSSPTIQKCGGCRCVSYCCKEHQTAHWKEHKKECKLLQDLKN
jgi:hypothetical protein